jgi:hypothetical protein
VSVGRRDLPAPVEWEATVVAAPMTPPVAEKAAMAERLASAAREEAAAVAHPTQSCPRAVLPLQSHRAWCSSPEWEVQAAVPAQDLVPRA